MSEVLEDINPNAPDSKKKVDNPFPGLRPFKIEESHLFFGREGQSDEVLLKLSKHRFVGVIGPSGSGKSSFIYCGVLPILYGGFLTDTSPDWEVVVTRPGAGPIDNLAESIISKDPTYIAADEEEKKIKRTITTTLLKSSSLGLVEAVLQSRRSQDKNYLILVDQFEELFRFKDSDGAGAIDETLAFVNLLIEASNYSDVPIYVAITMRSDFIGDCAQFPDLTKKINDSHYLIPQMTRDQKRRAIEGPVAVGEAQIAQRLTQQLLNDLGDSSDQLPILQHALMRTWSYWSRYKDHEEEALDIKHYEAIGTMAEALSMHANEAYDELTDDQKLICESLFKAITEKRGESFGIRRPTRLGEIAAIADVSEEEVIEVIDKFRDPTRSLLTPAHTIPLNSKSMIDISHESLMRIWVRLKNWVDDEADAVQMYLRLSEAAAMYQVGKAGLWRPPDLQLALNWQAKHRPTLVWGQRYHPAFERTMIFLEYSKKEFETEQRIKELQAKRRLRNARIVALVLAAATVISLGFLIFAFYQQTQANEARIAAETNLIEADKQRKLALANEAKADSARQQAVVSAELATKEAKNARIAERAANEAKTEADIQKLRAIKNEEAAKQSAEEANAARLDAEEQTKIAEVQKTAAELAEENADRLRMLAIGKSMAIKSSQLRKEQKELKGLLAQQAYLFNTNNEGDPNDNDIFNGLYKAIKVLKDPLVDSLGGHNKGIRAVASSSTGNLIFTSDTQGKILKWSIQGVNRVANTIIQARPNHLVRSIDVTSNNSKLIAAGEFPKTNGTSYVEVFDINTNSKKEISGFDGDVWNVIVAPDDNTFIALDGAGNSIKSSDFNTVTNVVNSSVRLNDIALSEDGKYIIGGGNNGKVYLYDVNSNYSESVIFDNGVKVLNISISKDNVIGLGDENGVIKLFTLFGNGNVTRLVGHSSPIEDIVFSTDGRFIATASRDKTVRLWNRKNLTAQPITLDDHPDWVFTVAFSPDNSQVLAGTKEQIVRAWPTDIEVMADKICSKIENNMSQDEWNTFVAEDIEYEKTCEQYDKGN